MKFFCNINNTSTTLKHFYIYDNSNSAVFFYSEIEGQWLILIKNGFIEVNGVRYNSQLVVESEAIISFGTHKLYFSNLTEKVSGITHSIFEHMVNKKVASRDSLKTRKILDLIKKSCKERDPYFVFDCIRVNPSFDYKHGTLFLNLHVMKKRILENMHLVESIRYEYDQLKGIPVTFNINRICTEEFGVACTNFVVKKSSWSLEQLDILIRQLEEGITFEHQNLGYINPYVIDYKSTSSGSEVCSNMILKDMHGYSPEGSGSIEDGNSNMNNYYKNSIEESNINNKKPIISKEFNVINGKDIIIDNNKGFNKNDKTYKKPIINNEFNLINEKDIIIDNKENNKNSNVIKDSIIYNNSNSFNNNNSNNFNNNNSNSFNKNNSNSFNKNNSNSFNKNNSNSFNNKSINKNNDKAFGKSNNKNQIDKAIRKEDTPIEIERRNSLLFSANIRTSFNDSEFKKRKNFSDLSFDPVIEQVSNTYSTDTNVCIREPLNSFKLKPTSRLRSASCVEDGFLCEKKDEDSDFNAKMF